MSTSANARIATESNKRPSTASGAKSRTNSSRVAPRERPFSSGEVIPEDSASNASPRRSASGAHKLDGGNKVDSKRQTGRIHLSSRDNLQLRTRSPVKISTGDGASERSPRESHAIQPSSRSAEASASAPKKERKAARELLRFM